MFSYLLPASLVTWIAETVKARVERWAGVADRQLALAEAELADREAFAGITIPVAAITAEDSAANRIADVPSGNGKHRKTATSR